VLIFDSALDHTQWASLSLTAHSVTSLADRTTTICLHANGFAYIDS